MYVADLGCMSALAAYPAAVYGRGRVSPEDGGATRSHWEGLRKRSAAHTLVWGTGASARVRLPCPEAALADCHPSDACAGA